MYQNFSCLHANKKAFVRKKKWHIAELLCGLALHVCEQL